MYVFVYIQVCIYVCMYVCLNVCMHECMNVYVMYTCDICIYNHVMYVYVLMYAIYLVWSFNSGIDFFGEATR